MTTEAQATKNEQSVLTADDMLRIGIMRFNQMYKLPVGSYPAFWYMQPGQGKPPEQVVKRLLAFRATLEKEITEVEDIIQMLEGENPARPQDVLTHLADWFGDLIFYCLSEMHKHGLDPVTVLGIILASNFSKLNEDGTVSYDENGKVLKGPNFWGPELLLKQYIKAAIAVGKEDEEYARKLAQSERDGDDRGGDSRG